ncbi:MAG: hypothetical protein K6F09_02985 [Clostridiales bacterium]|nr:hypothetical protein [Clostridiales bacterium]
MKKQILHAVAAFLAAITALSSLSIMSFAAEKIQSAETLGLGSTAITLMQDEDVVFWFKPEETGYYRFASDCDDPVRIMIMTEPGGVAIAGNDDVVFEFLESGELYGVNIRNHFANETETFNVNAEFLGGISDICFKKLPERLVYMDKTEIDKFTNIKPSLFISLSGAVVNIKFESGLSVDMDGRKQEFFILKTESATEKDRGDYSFSFFKLLGESGIVLDDYVIGKNTVKLVFSDKKTILTYDITVIDYPIKSIEVIKKPHNGKYIHGVDGKYVFEINDSGASLNFYYSYDLKGLELKINYKDGTSKIAVYDGNDFLIDGSKTGYKDDALGYSYELDGSAYGYNEEIYIYLWNEELSYGIKTKRPGSIRQTLTSFFNMINAIVTSTVLYVLNLIRLKTAG